MIFSHKKEPLETWGKTNTLHKLCLFSLRLKQLSKSKPLPSYITSGGKGTNEDIVPKNSFIV
jgi:hypothetical protein